MKFLNRWASVLALALAAFIFNTTEFVPVALLTNISDSFGIGVGKTGLMLTIYAWTVSIGSLPLMLLTRRVERRKLLAGVMALFVVSHLLSFVAWNFNALLACRLGIAFAHAIFWSVTAAIAVRVAPQGRSAQALGLLSTGTVLAMVLGIPLGRAIGEAVGWRTTFLLIGILAAAVGIVLWKRLPEIPSVHAGSLRSVPDLFRRPTLVLVYLSTVLVVTAQFTVYSYIEPFALNIAHLPAEWVTSLLLIYGAAGIFGSYLFGKTATRFPRGFALTAVGVLTACLWLLLPLSGHFYSLAVLCLIWGIVIMCFGLVFQAKVLRLASDATDVAMSIFSGLYNVGIGGGALLGGIISRHLGLTFIGMIGGAIGLVSFAVVLLASKREDFYRIKNG